MNNRNDVVDAWRAVAVLLVTAFHIFVWSKSQGIQLPFGMDLMGIFGNGWVGVGMFFVLSGYCMASSTQKVFKNGMGISNYLVYLLNRFLRIAGPYYISMCFWIIVISCFGVAVKPVGFIDILSHVLFLHNFSEKTMFSVSGVYWSLAVEMQFYLLLPLIFILCKNVSAKVVLLLITLASSVLVNTYSSDVLITWSLIGYLYLFVIGWFLSSIPKPPSGFWSSKKIMAGVFILFALALSYKGLRFNNMIKIYEIITSTMFALLLYLTVNNFTGASSFPLKTLSFIGRASYSIYLYNYIFWFFDRDNVSDIKRVGIYLLVILVGIFMHFVFEKQTEKLRKKIISYIASRNCQNLINNAAERG